RHEVGAADQVGGDVAGLDDEGATVFEPAAQHAADADVLGQALDAGAQSAHRARDDVDLGARPRRVVERVDHLDVGEVVRLDPDPGPLAPASGVGHRGEQLQQPR